MSIMAPNASSYESRSLHVVDLTVSPILGLWWYFSCAFISLHILLLWKKEQLLITSSVCGACVHHFLWASQFTCEMELHFSSQVRHLRLSRWLPAQRRSRLERRYSMGALPLPWCPWLYPHSTQQGDGRMDAYVGPQSQCSGHKLHKLVGLSQDSHQHWKPCTIWSS